MPDGEGRTAFFDVPELGLQFADFGQAPVYVDFDRDGRPDVLMLNQNQHARAFLNRSDNNWLTVVLPDAVSSLGARVTVESDTGKSATREMLSSVGFMTDHTPELHFGLGDAKQIREVRGALAGRR